MPTELATPQTASEQAIARSRDLQERLFCAKERLDGMISRVRGQHPYDNPECEKSDRPETFLGQLDATHRASEETVCRIETVLSELEQIF